MITQQDLQEAIAECQGVRNPNASTCLKLAAFLTIQRELYGNYNEEATQSYSLASHSYDIGRTIISHDSDTEFGKIINGKDQDEVLDVIDELMSTLQIVQPRIYASVLRKLKETT